MNRWNNEAGRLLIKRMTHARCKCHGLSGSCEIKTCWQQMPQLRDIGNMLSQKYEQAVRVRVNARGNLQQMAPIDGYRPVNGNNNDDADDDTEDSTETEPELKTKPQAKFRRSRLERNNKQRRQVRSVRRHDLIYIDESPDYCRTNTGVGIAGTTGRACNITSHGLDSCDLLCCGRGFNTYTQVTTEKCNCHFQWCCKVVCDACTTVKTTHVCK